MQVKRALRYSNKKIGNKPVVFHTSSMPSERDGGREGGEGAELNLKRFGDSGGYGREDGGE